MVVDVSESYKIEVCNLFKGCKNRLKQIDKIKDITTLSKSKIFNVLVANRLITKNDSDYNELKRHCNIQDKTSIDNKGYNKFIIGQLSIGTSKSDIAKYLNISSTELDKIIVKNNLMNYEISPYKISYIRDNLNKATNQISIMEACLEINNVEYLRQLFKEQRELLKRATFEINKEIV